MWQERLPKKSFKQSAGASAGSRPLLLHQLFSQHTRKIHTMPRARLTSIEEGYKNGTQALLVDLLVRRRGQDEEIIFCLCVQRPPHESPWHYCQHCKGLILACSPKCHDICLSLKTRTGLTFDPLLHLKIKTLVQGFTWQR